MGINIHSALSSGKVIVTGGDFVGNSNCIMWFDTKIEQRDLIVPTLIIHELGRDGNLPFEIEGVSTHVLWGNKIDYGQISERAANNPQRMVAEITNMVLMGACKNIRFNVTSNHVSCHVRMPQNLILHNMDAILWNTTEGLLEHFFQLRIPNRKMVSQMLRPEE